MYKQTIIFHVGVCIRIPNKILSITFWNMAGNQHVFEQGSVFDSTLKALLGMSL